MSLEKQRKNALKIAICSWCYGIGGGAARMESYYYQYYNRALFEPHFFSLVLRPESGPSYDTTIPFIQIDQNNRFFDLIEKLEGFDIIQFQGSFNPIVCEASKYLNNPHILLEVLHNIEEGALIDSVDATVCVSKAVAKLQKPTKNHKTILNGIKLSDYPFSNAPKTNDKIILLQVGRREKIAVNLDEIADEILSIDPRIELWIAGGEQDLQSTDRIRYLGVRKDIAELYRQAHFMVLLSKEEPFGLVALESMASGTPVILSKSGGFLDIIENQTQGFLVEGPSKVNAITTIKDALSTLGTKRYANLVQAGRTLVESKFSIEDCVKQYEDYILELCESKLKKVPKDASPLSTPPNALVGEALFDFQARDFQAMNSKLSDLSLSPIPITELHALKLAHDLARFQLKEDPKNLPTGLFPYLFTSGDRTEFTCNQILNDIEYLKQRGLLEEIVNYYETTKLEFPDRWERIQELNK